MYVCTLYVSLAVRASDHRPLIPAGESCEFDTARGSCPAVPPAASRAPSVCRGGSVCADLQRGGFLCDNCTNSPYRDQRCQLTARSFSEGSFLTFPALHQRHRLSIKLK